MEIQEQTVSKSAYDELQSKYDLLQFELAQLKRMLFGSKSEKHTVVDAGQGSLFDLPAAEKPSLKQTVCYERKKPDGESHYLWDKLLVFTRHAQIQPDNNLIENTIRPIAVGRKNYLFAGSHPAAQYAAMMYSFLSTCKIQQNEGVQIHCSLCSGMGGSLSSEYPL